MTTNRQNSRRNNFSYDFRARKKPISKVIKGLPVDYKDVDVLLSYISDRAKISSSYRTGNAAKDHRSLTKAIKRARHMALLPISHEHDIVRTSIEETSSRGNFHRRNSCRRNREKLHRRNYSRGNFYRRNCSRGNFFRRN